MKCDELYKFSKGGATMRKPREKETGKRFCFWLKPSLVGRIDGLAKRADLSQGRMIENMLEVMTETLESSEKVGVFQLSLLLRDLREGMKGWVDSVKREPQFVGKGDKLVLTFCVDD